MQYFQVFRKGQRDSPPVIEGDDASVATSLAVWGTADLYEVYDGSEYADAREFVVRMGGYVRPADGSLSPEERMRQEDLFDPLIHIRNQAVLELVQKALRLAEDPHYDVELLAKNTQYKIIHLFYKT